MSELQKYKKMLKDNEAEIKLLTDANKHIKDHIKFLEKFGMVEPNEIDNVEERVVSPMPDEYSPQ